MSFRIGRYVFGFRGSNQLPLFMLVREYYDERGEVSFADIVFMIKGRSYEVL